MAGHIHYNQVMLTNAEIAALLRQVAAVFEVKDKDFFRTRAYQNAANAVENLTISARDLWEQDKLDEIPGVGPNIAGHLSELFKTGKVRHFDHELKRVPAGMFPLLDIRGIGPKSAFKIATKYRLDNGKTALSEIKKLIAAGRIKDLPGFGEKSQQKIKTSIEAKFTKKTTQRLLLSEALPIAERFLNYLKVLPEVKYAEPLGSIRRRVATVGDIDLAIAANEPEKAMRAALKYDQIARVISSGGGVSRVQLKTGHEIDIKVCTPAEWGSLLQHYTGSKLHNIALRSFALKQHLSLSEHGIKNTRSHKTFKAKDEKEFYAHLGLPYLPPEIREGEEEISQTTKNQIPSFVDLPDIKGDLHIHSSFEFASSHDIGTTPLSRLLEKARDLGYEYIGISDHNPKYSGLTNIQKNKIISDRTKSLRAEYIEYENSVKNRVPKILIGLEVDIRSDGQLALSDELSTNLDYLIVSVHSNFDLSRDQNTKRLITALSHPKALILGHPTGRLLGKRDGLEADWVKVIQFCQANQKILEVNASPERLDLPDDLVKIAVRSGVKLAINSDSHEVSQMDSMKYGVWTARRGWAQKKDVINTYPFVDLQKVLR